MWMTWTMSPSVRCQAGRWPMKPLMVLVSAPSPLPRRHRLRISPQAFLVSRASFSNPSSTLSPGAYFSPMGYAVENEVGHPSLNTDPHSSSDHEHTRQGTCHF